MRKKIALIDGDNIGPELMKQTKKVLLQLITKFNIDIELVEFTCFGKLINKQGLPITDEILNKIADCDAVIIGNIGEKKYSTLEKSLRPEAAFLAIRKKINTCSSIRRFNIRKGLESLSPLKDNLIKDFDITVVRDIQGGMFSKIKSSSENMSEYEACDIEYYSTKIVNDCAKHAFTLANERKQILTSADKSNVLNTGSLWRDSVNNLHNNYLHIKLNHDYADNLAMKLIQNPSDYSVILSNNFYGDILSDEIAALAGTPSLFGNSEIANNGKGIYTPNLLHYPYEENIGKNIVSPIGLISTLSDLFTFSIKLPEVSKAVDYAINQVFENKFTNPEIKIPDFKEISTDEMGDKIAYFIKNI